jgi:hypothetical protein
VSNPSSFKVKVMSDLKLSLLNYRLGHSFPENQYFNKQLWVGCGGISLHFRTPVGNETVV